MTQQAAARDLAWVALAYLAALGAAWAVMRAPLELPELARLALADLAATVAVFGFSVAHRNTSVYDPYWSVMPPVLAAWLYLQRPGLPAALALGAVSLWGARLTFNWLRGWGGLTHEDWRYVRFRRFGRAYWLISFFGLQLFPSVMTFAGALPLMLAPRGEPHLGALGVAGLAVMVGATVLEAVADEQLRAFRRAHASTEICTAGVWSWSRHPNYFGELCFWAGLLLVGLAAGAPGWTACGLAALVALFVFASIPMAEQRSLERRPGYREHQQRVSVLLPLPPRRPRPTPAA